MAPRAMLFEELLIVKFLLLLRLFHKIRHFSPRGAEDGRFIVFMRKNAPKPPK